jgi:predicted adenine nucleotide alpha hydrolase (AANH) superfamily ATPase
LGIPLNRPKLLLHTCCAPCATHPALFLGEEFEIALFFYNPNIHPESERTARTEETKRLAAKWGLPVIIGDDEPEVWNKAVLGLEAEIEGGQRCEVCFQIRLKKTFHAAVQYGFDKFTSTLSVSPHKNAALINRIGKEIGGNQYLEADFKKKDGFKKSCDLSRSEGLYRQDYCGCRYSRKQDR